jgi:hypothetical protein
MKVTIMTSLFAKRDMDVDSGHILVISGQFLVVSLGEVFSVQFLVSSA